MGEYIENFANIHEGLIDIAKVLVPFFIGGVGVLFKTRKKIAVYLRKLRLKLFPINFNVGLFLNHEKDKNTELYYKTISKNLHKLVIELGLEKHIKIQDYSNLIRFKNTEEAETFRAKKDIDLIIWGGLEDDSLKIKGDKICGVNIKYTYGYLDDSTHRIGDLLKKDLNSRIAVRQYSQILESESLRDTNIVSKTTIDVALYILAKTLMLYGEINDSITLLERLRLSTDEDSFKEAVNISLAGLYRVKITELQYRKSYQEAKQMTIKLLNLQPNDQYGLTTLSVITFKLGELSETESLVDKVLHLYPHSPVTHINIAFIRIIQKKYRQAYKHYKKLLDYKDVERYAVEVFAFLTESYQELKDPAFKYASGIIYYYFGDRKIGKEDLEEFVKLAKNECYRKMRNHAEIILA